MRWFFLLLLVACSPRQEPKTLRLSFAAEAATFDPSQAADFASSTLVCLLYDGLTRCVPGGEVEPALAEEVEISADQKVYLFHLRKAHWSDGRPITAADFERAWKKILSPPTPCAFLFYPIKNGEKCAKGEVSVAEVGIKALDEKTLRVELENPTPYFYSLTAFPSFLPAPEQPGVYSGPFRLEKREKGTILLVKNEAYWNKKEVFLDQIDISIIPDEMTAYQLFERGELDWLGGPLSPLPLDAIESNPKQLISIPSCATTFITFNTEKIPFNARKALALAIDRREIVEQVTPPGQVAACRILPPPLTAEAPLFPLFDPAGARLHWEEGALPPLTLYYKTGQIEKRIAQTVQQQWKKNLGLSVRIEGLDPKSLSQRLNLRDYHLALTHWIAQFNDPISILDRFRNKENGKNFPGWENEQYQQLLREAAASSRRRELLLQAEEILAESVPLTPIYHSRSLALAGLRISRIGTTPSGGILFERFDLAKKR